MPMGRVHYCIRCSGHGPNEPSQDTSPAWLRYHRLHWLPPHFTILGSNEQASCLCKITIGGSCELEVREAICLFRYQPTFNHGKFSYNPLLNSAGIEAKYNISITTRRSHHHWVCSEELAATTCLIIQLRIVSLAPETQHQSLSIPG